MLYGAFGNTGERLSRIGLGCYGMSGAYGSADEDEAVATIHMAIDLGVNLLDTSASYGQGHNHRLIGRAVRDRRHQVFIHSKSGTIRTAEGRSIAEGSGTPERLRATCEESLMNLGIDALDAFCLSRIDPTVRVEESVGGMARLVEEGKTRFIGLSEAAPETVQRGHAVHPLCSLQYEYSLWSRDPEKGHIATCRRLDMAFMAYAPLGYGMLAGALATPAAVANDSRAKFPRLQPGNFERNRELVERLVEIAAHRKATPAQIAIAWVLACSGNVFAIPGCKTRRHLEENLAAAELTLEDDDLKALDKLFPAGVAAGDRYPPDGMRRVNLSRTPRPVTGRTEGGSAMLEEFKKFAMRGNVVDLAVGVVIGIAFGAIVTSFVTDLITPIIGAVTGGLDFSNYYTALSSQVQAGAPYEEAKKQGAVLGWGQFLTTALYFLIVAWVLFLVVKGINRLKREEPPAPPAEPAPDVKLLTEIRDLLKSKPS